MRVTKRSGLIAMLAIIVLAMQSRTLAAEDMLLHLPPSQEYQGKTYFGDGRIEFAVYDTQTYDDFTNISEGFIDDLDWWPSSSTDNLRYIYAYQIFLDDTSTITIDYFAVGPIGEGSVVKDESTNDEWPISFIHDLTNESVEPVEPSEARFGYLSGESESMDVAIWQFDNGVIAADERSWLLVFGSNQSWGAGEYTFDRTALTGVIGPIGEESSLNHTPEPTTIALLGLGSLILLRKSKKGIC